MTTVRAPASSANLGPGFDVLGLALNRYVHARDAGPGEPCRPDHIARVAHRAAGGSGDIWFDIGFPPGRGLGFSAAARAAGAVLALTQQGMEEDIHASAYAIVAQLEGHGDNAAPAVFGGVHVVAGDLQHRLPVNVPGELMFWVPDHESTSTDLNRLGMSTEVERSDAVFNLGRVGLLIAALFEEDVELLRQATEDRLHQPNRFAACPPSFAAHKAALNAGAVASWLSGSGPTVAVVARPGESETVAKALPPDGEVYHMEVDNTGAIICGC